MDRFNLYDNWKEKDHTQNSNCLLSFLAIFNFHFSFLSFCPQYLSVSSSFFNHSYASGPVQLMHSSEKINSEFVGFPFQQLAFSLTLCICPASPGTQSRPAITVSNQLCIHVVIESYSLCSFVHNKKAIESAKEFYVAFVILTIW